MDAKGGDHPDIVPGIEGNRGVTGTVICATCEDGETRQKAATPGLSAIRGSRKTDVRSSTIKEAANLKCGHDGVAKGKGVRLDFRLVLTGVVGERVAADLGYLLSRRKGENS